MTAGSADNTTNNGMFHTSESDNEGCGTTSCCRRVSIV